MTNISTGLPYKKKIPRWWEIFKKSPDEWWGRTREHARQARSAREGWWGNFIRPGNKRRARVLFLFLSCSHHSLRPLFPYKLTQVSPSDRERLKGTLSSEESIMKRHERRSFSLALHSSFSVMLKKMANSTSEDDHPPTIFPPHLRQHVTPWLSRWPISPWTVNQSNKHRCSVICHMVKMCRNAL